MSASADSRARQFDGFDRGTPAHTGAVPEAALDRIVEAATRMEKYVAPAVRAKLAELWDPDTLLGFAFLMALWAGFQFTPVGWLADVLLAAYGLYELGADIVKPAYQAATAETDAQLEEAAQAMARGLTDATVDAIAALIGGLAFGKLRRLLRVVRKRILPRRFGRATESRLVLPARVIGVGAGAGLAHGSIALGQAKKEYEESVADVLRWGAAIAGGLVLVGGAVAWAGSGPEGTRR